MRQTKLLFLTNTRNHYQNR